MPLTAEQSRALIDAIATAASLESLTELQQVARREHLLDARGGFLELLIAVRLDALTNARVPRPKDS